ncbi:MAG: AAA-like domain-containing protein [Bacteroidales bacterium]|nr:AAA-like domain-containing protein [Bacteroidales bacterium]MCM1415500.1 AAA-like domain-containing protein [bacterium]MCM1423437.1 AAA-like domain-containing protein [bacterium]
MTRYFNTEGCCDPEEHYMVNLDDRLEQIKRLYIDRGKYFVINRGRQYGKTTTLMALTNYLKDAYSVWHMDFQMMSTSNFASEQIFVAKFIRYVEKLISKKKELKDDIDADALHALSALKENENASMDLLFGDLSKICETAKRPIVLMIDEVDSASNNQVFLDFLALLRGYYLDRKNSPIFHSVVLAGVYDIKNLKLKIRPDAEHQYNSPWNIAAKFNVEMSFSVKQIADMLWQYETDHKIGMDVEKVAEEIYQYTSGYPYLVSAICKYLDEEISGQQGFESIKDPWTRKGIAQAVKILLAENIPLFDSMVKQLDTYKELRDILEQILYQGKSISFSPADKSISLGLMFGFLKQENGRIAIANHIFEMYLLNLFMVEESLKSDVFRQGQNDKNQFIKENRLDMDLVLKKFVEYFTDIYGDNDEKFVEKFGRKFFLLYLKPIINGTGNYYLEAQTLDARRTDVIVDYLGEQYVVELKIWHGTEYNERGEQQLIEYLNYFHQKKGYMLSFNFNQKKEIGIKVITLGDKTIVEAVV